jgi:hypothetical protein
MCHVQRIIRFGPIARLNLIGAVLIFVLPGFSQEIVWIRNYDAGMKLARESGRPALVDFWSEWCIPSNEDRSAGTSATGKSYPDDD